MNHSSVSAFAILALAALAGCQSSPPMQVSAPVSAVPSSEPLAWVRKDGQSGRANPALFDQFKQDTAACVPPPGDNAALRAAEGCMSERGYVLVPASQAAATAEQFKRQAGY